MPQQWKPFMKVCPSVCLSVQPFCILKKKWGKKCQQHQLIRKINTRTYLFLLLQMRKDMGGEIENSAEGGGGRRRRYDFSLVYIFYNSFQEPQQPQFDCICQSIDAWVPLALHRQLLVWLVGWMVGYFKTIFVNPTRELLQTSSGNGRNCLIKIIIILMNALNHNNSNVKFPKNKSKKMKQKQNLILWQRFWNHREFACMSL